MHRFFVEPDQIQGARVLFADAQAHQIARVLRLRPGDQVVVLDNRGWQYMVVLETAVSPQLIGTVRNRAAAEGEPRLRLTLYQALLQRDKFEWVLQKGTEIGVARFVPLLTRRSLVQTAALKANKQARWHKILTEAAEQSWRGRVPELAPPVALAEALGAAANADLGLLTEVGAERPLRAALHGLPTSPIEVALFIGPEGGFDVDEVAQAQAAGVTPVSLGPRVLRTETAAIVAAALILHELGEMA